MKSENGPDPPRVCDRRDGVSFPRRRQHQRALGDAVRGHVRPRADAARPDASGSPRWVHARHRHVRPAPVRHFARRGRHHGPAAAQAHRGRVRVHAGRGHRAAWDKHGRVRRRGHDRPRGVDCEQGDECWHVLRHLVRPVDSRQPGLVRARPERSVDGRRHRVLVLRRGARNGARICARRCVRHAPRRRCQLPAQSRDDACIRAPRRVVADRRVQAVLGRRGRIRALRRRGCHPSQAPRPRGARRQPHLRRGPRRAHERGRAQREHDDAERREAARLAPARVRTRCGA